MDEVEAAIKGKVDEWRYARKNAYVSGMFKKGTQETDLYELPFDYELKQVGYDIAEFYKQATGGLN